MVDLPRMSKPLSIAQPKALGHVASTESVFAWVILTFFVGACRKTSVAPPAHQSPSRVEPAAGAEPQVQDVWRALLKGASTSLSETNNCEERNFGDQRTLLELLSNMMGGGLHISPCAKSTDCQTQPQMALSLSCTPEVAGEFTCKLVNDDPERTGRAYQALEFTFLQDQGKVPAASVTCI